MTVAVERIDSRPLPAAGHEIRATLIVRNEIVRLPRVLDYHRALGVDRFLIVDDASDDGTREYLLEQSDVHVFSGAGRFATQKSTWRANLLSDHCQEIWTLNIDADELFRYPGMEDLSLRDFCSFLDREHADGLFAPMVDMYSCDPVSKIELGPNYELLDVFPYFDHDGYSARFLRNRMGGVSPEWKLRGGPRERIYFERKNFRCALRQQLIGWYFDLRRDQTPAIARLWVIGKAVDWLARKALPELSPELGKVPLLRWSNALGIKEDLSAMHWLAPQIRLSTCWGALLHFQYLPGYAARVKHASEAKLYGQADKEYERYNEKLEQDSELTFFSSQFSRRFESNANLIEVGLMRSSRELEALVMHGSQAHSPSAVDATAG